VGLLAVRAPNWLGDAVLATRALDALVAHAGEGPVVVLGRPWAPALWAERWPTVRFVDAPAPGGRWWRDVGPLRALHADTIVLLPSSLSARLHAYFAGVPRRVGLTGELLDGLLTLRAPRAARGDRHLEQEYLDLARLVGASPVPRRPLAPTSAARARVATRLAAEQVPDGAPVLALAPGAVYGPAKRWPPERFAELAVRWLRTNEGGWIALVGGAEDAPACRAVRAALPPTVPTLEWSGQTDVGELLALVARASACASNDSGFAHVAAASDRATAVVFGSTDPRWTAPRGARVELASRPPACSPCFRRTCAVAERYACLLAVSVDDALAALTRAGSVAGAA
jgi:heptosyltransferase-2